MIDATYIGQILVNGIGVGMLYFLLAVGLSIVFGLLRFVNHSCGPNTQLKRQQGRVEFYSLRDIAPGEELTADYGETGEQEEPGLVHGVNRPRGARMASIP